MSPGVQALASDTAEKQLPCLCIKNLLPTVLFILQFAKLPISNPKVIRFGNRLLFLIFFYLNISI